jgi:exosortase family protein XrtF
MKFIMLKRYKPTILFLLKFVLINAVLTQLYSYYLESFPLTDSFTYEVAVESSNFAKVLGFDSYIVQDEYEASVQFFLDDVFRVKIVEGCNGIAVMILFLSFIIAFGGRLIDILLFIPVGILLIHLSNIVRITLLVYIYVYNYDYANFFHDYIFPSIIYGMVFILWVIWVNYFAFISKDNKSSV